MKLASFGDQLRKFADENGISFDQYMDTWTGTKFGQSIPQRYKRLGSEVALAIPEGWDDHAEWTVDVGSMENPRGYASVLPFEEDPGDLARLYMVQIFPSLMDRLSDSACRWVIAHALAHIASKLRFGSIVIQGVPHTELHKDEYVPVPPKSVQEDAANNISLGWGFDREMQAFLIEDGVGMEGEE
jgi:hypothetical protein